MLLFLYPAFDVVAAVVDARSARTDGPVRGLYANIAVSSLAAVGIAAAGTSGVADVLRVWGAWGAWAIVSGLVQLLVGVARRPMGGQWAMIASGGISVLAGASFIRGAAQDDPALTTLAGYAVLGGIFFLVSAFRLSRSTDKGRR